jgi:hypothetical protein
MGRAHGSIAPVEATVPKMFSWMLPLSLWRLKSQRTNHLCNRQPLVELVNAMEVMRSEDPAGTGGRGATLHGRLIFRMDDRQDQELTGTGEFMRSLQPLPLSEPIEGFKYSGGSWNRRKWTRNV